ncbi:putative Sugar Porter (SP) Family MFS Transporter [Monocercomonoides exilis]|uniref:putative Sugar Porter (SP) Family MFS Transporter n=1 Tax=Monocercomonoides exilis TaxID=2049356 RepID=UPI003559EA71|nr:putative Sugar Porter (SP) Family MFS Transporter [Monocercomonoides exilis]|eukprot:MONOS_7444.1-p1 / transcript=MONOS_7444.1 / gene=MONOS_7444 / organism=Monocercomonoides_exilis_PA203 / gene_product=Sugar Porter (SP) Family MFS Transporter / transcript_product=Sugar Porter (SP) Family MFS Transporter / location=Mono_scaffold00254:63213-64877(-) / protein_length=475 / sequence_SO=supercontig / SO=protein_coding / is_pseudo=false
MSTKAHNSAAFFVTICAGMSYGITQSITSGIIEEEPWCNLSDTTKGLLSSSVLFGAAVGCLLSGFLSDKFGPKKVIMLSGLIVAFCSLGLALQSHVALFILLRIVSGLSIGALSSIGPLYVSEQSSTERRGSLVSMFQLSITVGILIDYVLNLIFFSVRNGWKWELGLVGVLPLLMFVGCCFCSESEPWLQKHRRQQKAYKREHELDEDKLISESNSSQLFSFDEEKKDDVQDDDIDINEIERITDDSPLSSLYRRILDSLSEAKKALLSSKRAFIVGVVLSMSVQLTGINAIIMYSPSIFATVGVVDHKSKLIATICVGLWNFVSTFFSVFLVDRVGRRPLMIVGYLLMALGHLFIVLSKLLGSVADKQFLLAIPGIAIFILGFEVGPGPTFQVLVSELYPAAARGRAMSVILTINWCSCILLVFTFLPLSRALSDLWLFAIFLILCVLTLLFVVIAMPETKGKSLEEIERER